MQPDSVYSVQFGESVERGFEEERSFPFFYNFVHETDDNWDEVKGAGTLANLTGIGPTVAPGETVDHVIILDPDHPYKLLWFKYTVYLYPQLAIASYNWYEGVAGWFLEYDYQTAIGTPLTRYIDMSVFFQDSNQRELYGGFNLEGQRNNQGTWYPLDVNTIQGYDYGFGQLRTPYLCPREGQILFKIRNTNPTYTFVVGGMTYGLKVRI